MLINFCKMQSLGNDFVIIDLEQFPSGMPFSADFFRKISDRNFGVGCDLVVLYKIVDFRSSSISVKVDFFNPDGSKAEICGNATRCIGLLMHFLKNADNCTMIADEKLFKINTKSKDDISIYWNNEITINSFDISRISESDLRFGTEKINIQQVFQVNVGNPHLILFVDNIPSVEAIKEIGKKIENNPIFPQKTNVGFVKKISTDTIELRVFERGAGLTLACGSGALAASIAAKQEGSFILTNSIFVLQKGGTLKVEFLDNGNYIQIGSADYIFSGTIDAEISLPCSPTCGKITIYTDGACSGNPGPGGWGVLIVNGEKTSELFGGESDTTNNRMELTAVIKALESVSGESEIILYTDSLYVKNGITQWINNWRKNNWRNSDKKLVKNQDLWKRLLEISKNRKITWQWVRGHDGNKLNERVDALARRACS